MARCAGRCNQQGSGTERAHFLIEQLIAQAREEGIDIPYSATTEYINTIPVSQQPQYPETRISRSGFAITSAGTPWPWLSAPTTTPTSGDILLHMPLLGRPLRRRVQLVLA